MNDDDRLTQEHFNVHLATGDIGTPYARTGYLGFIKRTDLTQTDGGKITHQSLVSTSHEL